MNSLEVEIVPFQANNLAVTVEDDIFKAIQVNANLIQSIETSITEFKKWREHERSKSSGNRKIKRRNNVIFSKSIERRDDEHNSKSRDCNETCRSHDFRMLHVSPSINHHHTNLTTGSFGSVIHKTSSLKPSLQRSSTFKLNHKLVNNFYKSQLLMWRLSIFLTLSNVRVTPVLSKKIFNFDKFCIRSTNSNRFTNTKALQRNITALLCKANVCVDIFSPNSVGVDLIGSPAVKSDGGKSEEAVHGRICRVNCHGDLKITVENDCDTKKDLNSMITKGSCESETSKIRYKACHLNSRKQVAQNETTAFRNNYSNHRYTVTVECESRPALSNKDQSRLRIPSKITKTACIDPESANKDQSERNEATFTVTKAVAYENKLTHANKGQSRITMPIKNNETISRLTQAIPVENKLVFVFKGQSRTAMPTKINERNEANFTVTKAVVLSENKSLANKDQSRITMPSKNNETVSRLTEAAASENKLVFVLKSKSGIRTPLQTNEIASSKTDKDQSGTISIVTRASENSVALANEEQSSITMPYKMKETTSTVTRPALASENESTLINKDQSLPPNKINERNRTTSTVTTETVDSENKSEDESETKIDTVSKKRSAPDFDTHTRGELKKQKINESQSRVASTSETEKVYSLGPEEHRDNTDPKWQAYKVSNFTDALSFMMNQWHVSRMCDPHVDLTARFNHSQQLPSKPKPSPQPTVSCTSIFDKKIDKIDNNIYNMKKKIDSLHDEYYDYNYNYRAQSRINSLIQQYTKEKEQLENEYANLCDVRHEVAQFYKFYNAQWITQYQKNENDCQRNAILRYDKFYSSTNKY